MAITEWEIRRGAVGQGPVRILLCDDEPACMEALRTGILQVFAKLNMRCTLSAFRSPGALTEESLAACDLVFLDIDFEDAEENGIDIARALRRVNRHGLIFFVTNYIDYAPEGYEVQAFRYILKRDMDQVLERYILQAMDSMANDLRVLRLRDREQIVDVPLDRISYLEVLDHSVSIHAGERAYTISATLTSLEETLEDYGFLRIHKSYLVNMAHIRKFRSRECLLTDGTTLAVSEKNYSQQKQKYLLWKGLQ